MDSFIKNKSFKIKSKNVAMNTHFTTQSISQYYSDTDKTSSKRTTRGMFEVDINKR